MEALPDKVITKTGCVIVGPLLVIEKCNVSPPCLWTEPLVFTVIHPLGFGVVVGPGVVVVVVVDGGVVVVVVVVDGGVVVVVVVVDGGVVVVVVVEERGGGAGFRTQVSV